MKLNLTLLAALCLSFTLSTAQTQKCKSHTHWLKLAENDPEAIERRQSFEEYTANYVHHQNARESVVIPVVVHVLYNNAVQNISDAQIISQIEALNKDFRLMNADSLPSSHPFWNTTADVDIEFCLAKQDPNGMAHSGINRVQTNVEFFDDYEMDMKFSSLGGADNWDPTRYLNWWVVSFHPDSSTLGFATFPTDLAAEPELDGVVFRHEAFGTTGTAGSNGYETNNLGRTATHEVGHWLNLRHIWGDDYCGDDMVADTPEQEQDNYDCPSFPFNANNDCGSDANGEMFMNYMDYVDDACMVMFTAGQATRMHSALDGLRASIKTSTGCEPGTVGVVEFGDINFSVYPNPAKDLAQIQFGKSVGSLEVNICDLSGAVVATQWFEGGTLMTLPLGDLASGYYLLQVNENGVISTSKLIVQ